MDHEPISGLAPFLFHNPVQFSQHCHFNREGLNWAYRGRLSVAIPWSANLSRGRNNSALPLLEGTHDSANPGRSHPPPPYPHTHMTASAGRPLYSALSKEHTFYALRWDVRGLGREKAVV